MNRHHHRELFTVPNVVPIRVLRDGLDAILRNIEITARDVYIVSQLTWENALSAPSLFSEGRVVQKGSGSKGESKSFPAEPRREGSFNICYWVNVDGMDTQWIVRFPKPIAGCG